MTSVFDEAGEMVPCTVIEAGPCFVTQVKTRDRDGYEAVQLGFEAKPERLVSKPAKGHFARAGVKPTRVLREFRSGEGLELQPGQEIRVDKVFTKGDVVTVVGTSKGRGFQGVVKRHHFGGGFRTHGQSDRERAPGSIGSVHNLTVVGIIPDSNLLLVKGSVPGAVNGTLEIHKRNPQ
jgi:large subunit ribosomal protein L3